MGTKKLRIDNHHVDRIVILSDINRYFYHRSLLQKNFAVFSQPLYCLSSRPRADNVRVRMKKRNSSETNEVRAKLCRARKRRLGVNEKKTQIATEVRTTAKKNGKARLKGDTDGIAVMRKGHN